MGFFSRERKVVVVGSSRGSIGRDNTVAALR